jgi:hemolysin activation/secretion protein
VISKFPPLSKNSKSFPGLFGVLLLANMVSPFGIARVQAQTLPPPDKLPREIPRDNKPPSVQPIPEQVPEKIPAPADLLPPTVPTPSEVGPNTPDKITVTQFKVTGNTVFTQADFDAVTAGFRDRPISLTELFQARSAITQLYVDKGYITSGALIPPQKLKDGVVEIQVVEGRLEGINVTGTQRLNPGYVRSRIGLGTQTPLNRNTLLESLRLLQLDPLIKNLSAELSAGTRPGESLLDLKVTEARSFDVKVTLDNSRSPSVGTDRRRISLSEGNLTGLGDAISIGYTNTNGSNGFDFGYTLPVSPHNTTLAFNVGTSSSKVLEKPFDALNIQSRSQYYEVTLRHPLKQSPSEEFALGLTGSFRQSGANFLDDQVPFPAAGADADGKTRVSALRFFQEWTKRSEQQVLAFRSQVSLGVSALGSSVSSDGTPDSRFFTWRGQGQWVRALAPDTLLLVRGDVQLADRPLLGLEQFGLGGQETVRGYRQDALLTDGGMLLSVEGRIPLFKFGADKRSIIHLTPFLDLGKAWNAGGKASPESSTLFSAGLGLRLQLGSQVTARLDWGIPLTSIAGDKRTWQENGIYFSLTASPF